MKLILKNTGIQTAILAIGLGLLLTQIGSEQEGSILIGAAVTYIAGKMQRRPETVALHEQIDAAHLDDLISDSEGE